MQSESQEESHSMLMKVSFTRVVDDIGDAHVYGHKNRVDAIVEAWEAAGHVAYYDHGFRRPAQVDVILVDFVKRYHQPFIRKEEFCVDPYTTVVVSVTDDYTSHVESDIIINHSPIFHDTLISDGSVLRLYGPQYFLASRVLREAES